MKHTPNSLVSAIAACALVTGCAPETPNADRDPADTSKTVAESVTATHQDALTDVSGQVDADVESDPGANFGSSQDGSTSKNLDYEGQQRFNGLSQRLAPEQRALKEALKYGEWQSVLEQADALEALWFSLGGYSVTYNRARAEAYIGLGNPQEALYLIDPNPAHRGTAMNLTLALALAMTDQLDEQGARGIADQSVRFFDIERGYVPTPRSRNMKIAVVRMARAADAAWSAQDVVALREAEEALRLAPSLKIAAVVKAKVLNRMGRYEEALPYWRQASSLPGSAGRRARVMADSTESVVRQTGNGG